MSAIMVGATIRKFFVTGWKEERAWWFKRIEGKWVWPGQAYEFRLLDERRSMDEPITREERLLVKKEYLYE